VGTTKISLYRSFSRGFTVKRKLEPYMLPVLPEFKSDVFKKCTEKYQYGVEAALFKAKGFEKGLHDCWVSYSPEIKNKRRRKRTATWVPKLYVCVAAAFYWPTIRRLINESKKLEVFWKFYMAPSGYERPDKIVFYFGSEEALKHFVSKLRPHLPRRGFHDLRHSASTVAMGIEGKNQRGVFVGIDPPVKESWRIYRSLCSAWADLNYEYIKQLRGGRKRWFERMNLSLTHEGPHTLTPPLKNTRYIRHYWDMINTFSE